MFFSFLSLCASQKEAHLYGAWGFSYPYDESVLFFEYVRPDLTQHFTELFSDNQESLSYDEILATLAYDEQIPKHIYGLLNLSFKWNFFNPMASAIRSNTTYATELRGYGIEVSPKKIENNNFDNFTVRYLSNLYLKPTSEERVAFMRNFAKNCYSEIENIVQTVPLEELLDVFKELYKNNTVKSGFDVNGRIVDGFPTSTLAALLDETQMKTIFNYLGINDHEISEAVAFTEPTRDVYTYMEPPEHHFDLVHHDHGGVLARNSEDFNNETNSPEQFIGNRQQLTTMQIYADINDKSTLSVLRTAMEMATFETPFLFNVYVLGDLNNETEKEIIYSYVDSEMNLGARPAIKYLIEGMETGKWRQAYMKTRPKTKWNKLSSLYNSSSTANVVKYLDNYYKTHGITGLTYAVNGNFVEKDFMYSETKQFYLNNIVRLMDDLKSGHLVNRMNIKDYLLNESIIVDNLKKPLEIDDKTLISFAGIDARTITDLVIKLTNHQSYIHNKNNATNYIPVYFVDTNAYIRIEEIENDFPAFSFSEISSQDFSDKERSLLRIGYGPVTIVGPHVFTGSLNAAQLKYALKYVNMRYMHNLTKPLETRGLFYILAMRATWHLNGVQRVPKREYNTSLYIADYKNNMCEIKNTLIMDPFDPNFKVAIETAAHIADSGAAINWIIPVPSIGDVKALPVHVFNQFYPMFSPSDVAPFGLDSKFKGPSYWAVSEENGAFWMNGLLVTMIAPGADIVSAGGKFARATNDGYFQMSLIPGLYASKGVEEDILSASLVPAIRYMHAKKEVINVPESNTLDILTHLSGNGFEKNLILMLSTMKNHTNSKIRCFIVNPPRGGAPNGIEMVPLPSWLPPFVASLDDISCLIKHAANDFLLPADVHKVIFVDQSTIFNQDLARLLKINMENASIAAPLLSTYKKFIKTSEFFNREQRLIRANRPFHTSKLFVMNIDVARKQRYFDLYRYLLRTRTKTVLRYINFDEIIFNQLQLPCQFITLPEETSYSYQFTNPMLQDKAFSYFVYENEAEKAIFGIKNYTKMSNDAYHQYKEQFM